LRTPMKVNDGNISRRQLVALLGASAGAATLPAWAERAERIAPKPSTSVRFLPAERAVGDVMPFYHNGEYHVFYLLNAAGNDNVNWEHAVSTDLVRWEHLPPAIRRDPKDPTGPEGGCMFTGSVILHDGVFHAFYTSWNPDNPKGREFISHATSTDLRTWTKHPGDMIAPDGVHYANHQARDFRDPCVVWDEQARQFVMYILANQPGKSDGVFGVLTSSDLKTWKQRPAIEGIPGDECPDFFKSGSTYYMHGNNVYAFSESKDGPWRYPSHNKVDRSMAAKRVFDGKRHVWFGGWLEGPMSIPREVYEGPRGTLFMKPVDEIVHAFTRGYLTATDLSLKAGSSWQKPVPRDYLLEATFTPADWKSVVLTVREEGRKGNCHLVLSPLEGAIIAIGGESPAAREIPIDASGPVAIQAFIIGGVAEVFVNSQYAATFLIHDKGNVLRIEVHGDVVFKKLQIKVAGET
jgi:sucrose-6-phosphate hydrolase SacC (GH32 family)